MKKYLISPELNWYRANMHCHTTISDGHYTPAEIKKAYMDMGYSIVAYTDHELICEHNELTDDKFLAITSSEFSITDSSPAFEFPDGGYMDAWKARKTIPLGVYSKDNDNLFHPATTNSAFDWWRKQGKLTGDVEFDGYERIYTVESINETIKRLNENGFFLYHFVSVFACTF